MGEIIVQTEGMISLNKAMTIEHMKIIGTLEIILRICAAITAIFGVVLKNTTI